MDIEKILHETGIENIAECEFLREVEPPYIVHLTSGYDHIFADGKIVNKQMIKAVELYHLKTDVTSEKMLEQVLESHGINYSKGVVWLGKEQLYEKIYTFTEKETHQ